MAPLFCALRIVQFVVHMAARSRLKLSKEGLVEKLTKVVQDAQGEALADAMEDSPARPGPSRRGSLSGFSDSQLGGLYICVYIPELCSILCE